MIISNNIMAEINAMAEKYKSVSVQKLANDFDVNMTAKQSFNLIIKKLLKKSFRKKRISF